MFSKLTHTLAVDTCHPNHFLLWLSIEVVRTDKSSTSITMLQKSIEYLQETVTIVCR